MPEISYVSRFLRYQQVYMYCVYFPSRNVLIHLFISSKTSNLCGIIGVENGIPKNRVPTPLMRNQWGNRDVVYVRVGMCVYITTKHFKKMKCIY